MIDSRDIEWAERITKLEGATTELVKNQEDIKRKLDELLDLKSKGMGAFWLVSTIFGTGLVGLVIAGLNWLRNG